MEYQENIFWFFLEDMLLTQGFNELPLDLSLTRTVPWRQTNWLLVNRAHTPAQRKRPAPPEKVNEFKIIFTTNPSINKQNNIFNMKILSLFSCHNTLTVNPVYSILQDDRH
jgi:hypothetical protein